MSAVPSLRLQTLTRGLLNSASSKMISRRQRRQTSFFTAGAAPSPSVLHAAARRVRAENLAKRASEQDSAAHPPEVHQRVAAAVGRKGVERMTLQHALQPSDSKAGYRGVSRVEGRSKARFIASVWRAGKHVHLGSFTTAMQAAFAYARTPEARAAVANPRPAPLTAEEAVAQAAAEGITLERSNCASGYKGVRIGVRGESFGIRYEAQVRRARKQVFLGSFATAEEAALAYTRTPEAQAEAAKPKPTSLTAKEAMAQAAAEGFTLQRSKCASGYKGVEVAARVDCTYERYKAKVSVAGKPVFLGCFDTVEEAALAVARANERTDKPTGSPRPAAARRVMQPPKPPPAKPHYTPPPRPLRTMTPPTLSEIVAATHAPAPLRPNQRVRVWWDDETSFDGRLTDTHSELGRDGVVQQRFQVAYDDGERRWHLEDDVRVDGLAEEVCVEVCMDEWVTLELR